MRKAVFFVILILLFVRPAGAVELVKVATIPSGALEFYSHHVGDADHDGWRELYFEQTRSPFDLKVWEHWGANSYQLVDYGQECVPHAVGDPDEDGLTDLLCQWSGTAFLLESKKPYRFPSRNVWEQPLGGFAGLRGYFRDADQDGQTEMWIVPNDPPVVEVWENRGDNEYTEAAFLTHAQMNPATLAFGDFDRDGRQEIVIVFFQKKAEFI